ncbi:MAG: NAD(P)H-binding protein [Planctomycetota bacterium]
MQNQPNIPQNVLVIAASGKTGRRVADILESKGVSVRRGSRSGSPAFDWERPDTWAAALGGMDAAYVAYLPDLAVPQAKPDITRLVELAKEKGLKKLVLLSGRGEPEAQKCEQLVQQSGLEWTVVRAGWFNQNYSEGIFADMVAQGVIALPDADTREALIDVNDIAEVAAASFLDARHDGEVYEVTGPELLSHEQVAQQLSAALGRQIRYQPLTIPEFIAGLQQQGVPDVYLGLMHDLFTITASGVNAHVADGVERALGRAPRSFSDFVSNAAANNVFPPAAHETAEQTAGQTKEATNG